MKAIEGVDLSDVQGVYSGPEGELWERPASVELLQTDNSSGFQIDAGVRIRGEWYPALKMQWVEGGLCLNEFVEQRLGREHNHAHSPADLVTV